MQHAAVFDSVEPRSAQQDDISGFGDDFLADIGTLTIVHYAKLALTRNGYHKNQHSVVGRIQVRGDADFTRLVLLIAGAVNSVVIKPTKRARGIRNSGIQRCNQRMGLRILRKLLRLPDAERLVLQSDFFICERFLAVLEPVRFCLQTAQKWLDNAARYVGVASLSHAFEDVTPAYGRRKCIGRHRPIVSDQIMWALRGIIIRMADFTAAEKRRYTQHRAFTEPAVSARATRHTVPEDVWRSMEMVPGLLTWGTLIGAASFSFLMPRVVAYAILLFDVYWLMKSLSMSHSLIRAYRYLKRDTSVDWALSIRKLDRGLDYYESHLQKMVRSVTGGRQGLALHAWNVWQMIVDRPKQQVYRELRAELAEIRDALAEPEGYLRTSEVHHLVIVATYTEELDVLRPSFQALADTTFDPKRLIVVLATEEADKQRADANAAVLRREFGNVFKKFVVTQHPLDITGEVRGKGSNISWAGRKAAKEIEKLGLDPEQVIVTTLDADHRPHPQYFAAVTYHYSLAPDRKHISFQPTPLFHNNFWDAPAINRVTATGSSFWHMVESTRAYRLRNFAAHSQSLRTILDTDFWSVDTIVEDGQQFWRTYFAYDGNHYVMPVYVPVYQDAVLGDSYINTLRAQYLQLRRWAWGASDLPYILVNAWRNKRIPWTNKITQIVRFMEGHFTWATAPILITFVGWFPILLSPTFKESLFGQTLAPTASYILTMAMVGMVATILISLLLLPPRPEGLRKRHRLLMVAQWALMPVTTLFFSSLPAIESQTRLMFGKYLEFFVSPKGGKRARRAREAAETQ